MQRIILNGGKELLEDIACGESQVDAGKGISHDQALEMILKRFSR